jgi:hypothetical protein
MKTVTAFQSSDGELFSDEESAQRHEFFLSNKELIEDFLASEDNPYKSVAHRGIVHGSITRWEFWRAKNAK